MPRDDRSECGRTLRQNPLLDLARSIAIISITFNHAVNRSFAVNVGQFEEFRQIPIWLTLIKSVLYAFSRVGVPVFVMISGALLLPRNYDMETQKSLSGIIGGLC